MGNKELIEVGNEGWCTEGAWRSENIRFVIGTGNGKIKASTCHFGDVLVLTATRHGRLVDISPGGRRRLQCGDS